MIEFFEVLTKGAMRLSTPTDQSISDANYVVLEFDEVTMERGGIICDPTANTITVSSTGPYSVHIGVDGTFPGAEMLELMVYVNGAAYSPHPLILQGRANQKPVSIFWESTVNLDDGDVLDVRGRNGESGTFTLSLQRMYMAVIKEH